MYQLPQESLAAPTMCADGHTARPIGLAILGRLSTLITTGKLQSFLGLCGQQVGSVVEVGEVADDGGARAAGANEVRARA